ncbi:Lipid A biosynthesis lauroyl acyltransferase [compost metagenome]
MDRGNRLIYRVMKGIQTLTMALPRSLALRAGVAFADALYRVYRLTPYRGFVFGNIRKAFPSELTDREVHRLAHGHLRNLLKSIVEVLRFGVLERDGLDRLVSWEGREHLDRVMAEGRPVIFASAHFGNWEILAAALASTGLPLHVLVQVPSKDAFGQLFIEARKLVGVTTYANQGPASLRPVLRALKRGEALGILVDQHGEAQEAVATLFGRPVAVPMGAFFFAEKTGAAILPMFCVRTKDDRHVIHVEPELVPTGNAQEDARQMYAVLETYLRRYPEMWLWVHNRWEREAEVRPLAQEVTA